MPKPTTLLVELNVHKDFITVAHAEAHGSLPPVFTGSIGSRQADIEKLIRRLQSKTAHLVFACEAGSSRPIAWGHKRDSYLLASSEW